MSLDHLRMKLGVLCLLGAGTLVAAPRAWAIYPWTGCCHEKCPPKYVHCMEMPPCVKYKCGCPRPVCDPCSLPHFGYFQTCWQPWPYPPDWTHCPVPPPGALIPDPPPPTLRGLGAVAATPAPPEAPLPAPRRLEDKDGKEGAGKGEQGE